jgi:putative Ca2+/H+ antiporter (TMEM165/GDT1 family)
VDLKLFLAAFGTVFVAELGDKTQLALFAMAGSHAQKWSVFLGGALALVTTTAIAVVLGEAVSRAIPAVWLERGAGVVFIVLGVLYLAGKA